MMQEVCAALRYPKRIPHVWGVMRASTGLLAPPRYSWVFSNKLDAPPPQVFMRQPKGKLEEWRKSGRRSRA